jgi:5'-nucleotidase
MRILVTNDDGIHAPGLLVSEKIARALSDDVWVFAPETEQSGASHSLTLALPLRLRQITERRFAVAGTPTDCVMMAALHVLKSHPPELVLSGVNWGSNLADDVTYSGTIAGAMEGCALGIASIAMSQAGDEESRDVIDWSPGEVHAPALIKKLIGCGWPQGTLINMNFPGCTAAEVTGDALVPQGQYDLQSSLITERTDVRGRPYYWNGLRHRKSDPPADSDLGAISANKIAVTPLHMNLTDGQALAEMRRSLGA